MMQVGCKLNETALVQLIDDALHAFPIESHAAREPWTA